MDQHTCSSVHMYSHPVDCSVLTTVETAPGLCILTPLTVWNTSTTPSALHCSTALWMAQYIPERPTVSLGRRMREYMYRLDEERVKINLQYLQWTTTGPCPIDCLLVMTLFMTLRMVAGCRTWQSAGQSFTSYCATSHSVSYQYLKWFGWYVCFNTCVYLVRDHQLTYHKPSLLCHWHQFYSKLTKLLLTLSLWPVAVACLLKVEKTSQRPFHEPHTVSLTVLLSFSEHNMTTAGTL